MGKTMSQSRMQAESWGKEKGDINEKETSQLEGEDKQMKSKNTYEAVRKEGGVLTNSDAGLIQT
jgi:hypothetical protein